MAALTAHSLFGVTRGQPFAVGALQLDPVLDELVAALTQLGPRVAAHPGGEHIGLVYIGGQHHQVLGVLDAGFREVVASGVGLDASRVGHVSAVSPARALDGVTEKARHPLLARGRLGGIQAHLPGHQGDGGVTPGTLALLGLGSLELELLLDLEIPGVGCRDRVQTVLPVGVNADVTAGAHGGAGVAREGEQSASDGRSWAGSEETVVGVSARGPGHRLTAAALLEAPGVEGGWGARGQGGILGGQDFHQKIQTASNEYAKA